MPYSNNYSVKHSLKKLFMQHYDRYLPTAFDESMSLLEKMNKLIDAQNQLIDAINAHTQWTNETLERAFDIIDTNLKGQLEDFREEMDEQKRLYEEIRDKLHSDLMPDAVKQKLEEWLLNGTIEELINDAVFGDINERLEFLENIFFPPDDKITFYVPRDFNTLQESIDFVRKIRNGVDTEIIMQKGFRPSKGISLEGHDLGHVTLSSEDEVVTVADDFTGEFMKIYKSRAPILNTLIDMKDKGTYGLWVSTSSSAVINSQCGCINSGGVGVYVRTSTVTGAYSNFSGSNDRGLWATRGSKVSFPASNFSGIKGGRVGAYISRSTIADLSDINISNANVEYTTVQSLRSHVTLLGANLRNAKNDGVFASGVGFVALRGADVTNCGGVAIKSTNGSRVDLGVDTNLSNAKINAISITRGASVSGSNINARNCKGTAVTMTENSTLSAPNMDVSNAQGDGIYMEYSCTASVHHLRAYDVTDNALSLIYGCDAEARQSDIRRAGKTGALIEEGSRLMGNGMGVLDCVSNGVSTRGGSNTVLRGGSVKGSGSSDLIVFYGGQLSANGLSTTNGEGQPALSDTNVESFNTVSARGIIFR